MREWIGVLASLCLSKKMSLQGVVGSLRPYTEAFSGAWLQACMAAASTHCGFCPWLQFCQRWGRGFIDVLSDVIVSHILHMSLQKIYRVYREQCEQRIPGHRDHLSWKGLQVKAPTWRQKKGWGLEGCTPPIMRCPPGLD